MNTAPRGMRLVIGLFGRRNVGKSSLLNCLTDQALAIVSDTPGTTTDPVEKAMELHPVGPVLWIDTAGIDDSGVLGLQRVEKTFQAVARTDLALLLTNGVWGEYEMRLLEAFRAKKIPYLIVDTQCDNHPLLEVPGETPVHCSVKSADCRALLLSQIIDRVPEAFLESPCIVRDLLPENGLLLMVIPIDSEAPKGRLILPEVQTLRDALDGHCLTLVCTDAELPLALKRLAAPPDLIVCDSQAFAHVDAGLPPSLALTSFSILFARLKGDLKTFIAGARTLSSLRPGDRVLIAEACTHHAGGEDIGRVKIPALLAKKAGGVLQIDHVQGCQFPDDLRPYKLVIHCGGCTFNRRLMMHRIARAAEMHVPMTNYGLTIAACLGILDRAVAPLEAK